MAGFGTLNEVKHKWSFPDLVHAHEMLDIKAEVEAVTAHRARGKGVAE